ncbi:MAG: hypothetical protein GY822_32280 [Deltaproteobacteria bacterium]|nr:hypothetical protein [Deltaproteobacteria bacterium]
MVNRIKRGRAQNIRSEIHTKDNGTVCEEKQGVRWNFTAGCQRARVVDGVRSFWPSQTGSRLLPGFGFVRFHNDFKDAENAMRALNGSRLCGSQVRLDMWRRKPRRRQRN